MNHEPSQDTDVTRAEREALGIEADEHQAQQRFDRLRAELAASGKAEEATSSREFGEWMDARARTDAA